MGTPVDLTNLRSMTEGDTAMEKELFEEFYVSFEAGIRALQTHCSNDNVENWRKEAHALKGIALNLGAEKLGEICKQAQENCAKDPQTKNVLLQNLQEEYKLVHDFLGKLAR